MISKITGEILLKSDRFAIIDVSGIGYKIYISNEALHKIGNNGEKTSIWTHLIVRENALDLYGFCNYAEIEMFEMLISVSGIGPKSALGIMGVAPLDTLKSAISSSDTSYLTKVSGIGKKIAEKIIIELKDKLGVLEGDSSVGTLSEEADVVDALQAIGYSLVESREAIKKISSDTKGTSEKIKEALKHLGS